jgi:hypothetical protein
MPSGCENAAVANEVQITLRVERDSLALLYRLAAWAALTVTAVYLLELAVVARWGLPPSTVEGVFAVFAEDRYTGLLRVFAFDLVAATMHLPLFFALFVALGSERRALVPMSFALLAALVGLASFYASNTVISMLSLSDQYAAATSDAQRASLLAAGHAMLGSFRFDNTGLFVAFDLYAIAGLIASAVMRHSRSFARGTAWLGLVGNAIQLAPPRGVGPGWYFDVISPIQIGVGGIVLIAWYVSLYVDFRRLRQASLASG